MDTEEGLSGLYDFYSFLLTYGNSNDGQVKVLCVMNLYVSYRQI